MAQNSSLLIVLNRRQSFSGSPVGCARRLLRGRTRDGLRLRGGRSLDGPHGLRGRGPLCGLIEECLQCRLQDDVQHLESIRRLAIDQSNCRRGPHDIRRFRDRQLRRLRPKEGVIAGGLEEAHGVRDPRPVCAEKASSAMAARRWNVTVFARAMLKTPSRGRRSRPPTRLEQEPGSRELRFYPLSNCRSPWPCKNLPYGGYGSDPAVTEPTRIRPG